MVGLLALVATSRRHPPKRHRRIISAARGAAVTEGRSPGGLSFGSRDFHLPFAGYGGGCQNQWHHPILEPFLVGDWDVHWGYGILTHGHIALLGIFLYSSRVTRIAFAGPRPKMCSVTCGQPTNQPSSQPSVFRVAEDGAAKEGSRCKYGPALEERREIKAWTSPPRFQCVQHVRMIQAC